MSSEVSAMDREVRLITVDEAADKLGMSERWVWQQISKGVFRRVKPSGDPNGRTRLLQSEVEAFILKAAGANDASV